VSSGLAGKCVEDAGEVAGVVGGPGARRSRSRSSGRVVAWLFARVRREVRTRFPRVGEGGQARLPRHLFAHVRAHGAVRSDLLYHTGWSVMATGRLEAITEPQDLHRMEGLPVRAWGRAAEHLVRMPIKSITGRRIEGAPAGR
jgi:hypothetical protein